MAQVALGRNTSNERPRKSRNWQFTLNNYTPEEIETICDSKYQYIFQEETGSEGTPHLQGMISSANAISFNSVKNLIPRAHIEAAKNKNALINYCQKGATRTGKIYCNVDSWLSGTESGTTQDPRAMSSEMYYDWLAQQAKESADEHSRICKGCMFCSICKYCPPI